MTAAHHAPDVAFFDLDGTLTDPYLGISRSFRYALDTLGISVAPNHDFRATIGPPMQSVVAGFVGDDPALQARMVALYRERFATVGLYENRPYDGIVSMLERVARSRTLYVCTSKPTVYATRILEHFGLASAFAAIYGSELDGTHADKGALLAHVLAQTGIDATRAIMIGDRSHDIDAARANGIVGVGVAWGYGSDVELRSAGAHTIFERPDAITAAALDEACLRLR